MTDAAGNVIATYDRTFEPSENPSFDYKDKLTLSELHIFGSSRLGMHTPGSSKGRMFEGAISETGTLVYEGEENVFEYHFTAVDYGELSSFEKENTGRYFTTSGKKIYELSNHLGNVNVTISDQKIAIEGATGIVDYYSAEIISITDYYAFGSPMEGRVQQTVDPYRYRFNGKELDTEGMGGGQSTYDYGFRIYNPAIARFLSVDPLSPEYPWYTPYQFAGNMPIWAIDVDGLEPQTLNGSDNFQEPKPLRKLWSVLTGTQFKIGAEIWAAELQKQGNFKIEIIDLDPFTTVVSSSYFIPVQDGTFQPLVDECGESVFDECGDQMYTANTSYSEVREYSVFRRARNSEDPNNTHFTIRGRVWADADLNLSGAELLALPYLNGVQVLDFPDPMTGTAKAGITMAGRSSHLSTLTQTFKGLQNLPYEIHHFATNKNSTFTPRMSKIADDFGLSLDGSWNKQSLPHRGRHPNDYHMFVLDGMENAKALSNGDPQQFLHFFDKFVKQPVIQNPTLLRKAGWKK